ncbi:Gfo/Idh/MocA family oxidoreductase [Steroidobacter sp. S1-65]|uniref:Gfo/Idh/MocA family oxidoreductase n=1 Tax=Steroidobacter gossypii TaxID=2805490 RepID=A0ABS1X3N6_9GAMM|nr:Gfo/Idh/MocA family oxidoreductase [Steroidobacter gossypii]MBM0107840.1 Gfo/Idh/MocA family oxidoreductase [Steroidobacter gossypii]
MRRRDLLVSTGLAVPGVFAAATTSGAERQARPVGVAMVGLGSYARLVMERTRGLPQIVVTGLVSGDRERATPLARDYGIPADAVYTYANFDRLAQDERIDAVHICLPVGLHAQFAEQALNAGKHVICEKPLAASSTQARRLARLAVERSRVLMPAYRAWFSPHVQEVRRRVVEAVHGPLVAIDAHKGFRMELPAGNWRFDPKLAGGGCLYDIGVYSVQLCRWLGGGVPKQVMAVTGHDASRPQAIEDHVAFTFEFETGVIATGSASWRHRLQNRLHVATRDSWMCLDPATPVIGERLTVGLERPNRIEELGLPVTDQLPRMYQHFADCIAGRARPQVSAEDAIDDLRVMEAIYASAQQRRAVSVM